MRLINKKYDEKIFMGLFNIGQSSDHSENFTIVDSEATLSNKLLGPLGEQQQSLIVLELVFMTSSEFLCRKF